MARLISGYSADWKHAAQVEDSYVEGESAVTRQSLCGIQIDTCFAPPTLDKYGCRSCVKAARSVIESDPTIGLGALPFAEARLR